MKKTVLLTGATGFVGRQILKSLNQQDISVRLVLRKNARKDIPHVQNLDAIVYTSDLFSEPVKWFSETCQDIELVIHAAWYAEPGKYLQSPENLNCLAGSLNFAQGAVLSGVKRFIGIGTCFEYDLKNALLSTDTPLNPSTLYAATKAAAFMTLSQYFSLHEIQFAWCRLFYLFGEGEDVRRFVPYLRSRLDSNETAELTSGNQIRDYLDVETAGKMIVQSALSHLQGPVNICSGIPITIRQFAENIADEYGRRNLLNFGSRPDNLIDPPCVLGIPTKLPLMP